MGVYRFWLERFALCFPRPWTPSFWITLTLSWIRTCEWIQLWFVDLRFLRCNFDVRARLSYFKVESYYKDVKSPLKRISDSFYKKSIFMYLFVGSQRREVLKTEETTKKWLKSHHRTLNYKAVFDEVFSETCVELFAMSLITYCWRNTERPK